MYLTVLNRVQLLSLLPEGGVVAELGVNKGGFATKILRHVKPAKLHLIDPWGKDADDEYVKTYKVKEDLSETYASVCKTFEKQSMSGQVQIHREYSERIVGEFPDA